MTQRLENVTIKRSHVQKIPQLLELERRWRFLPCHELEDVTKHPNEELEHNAGIPIRRWRDVVIYKQKRRKTVSSRENWLGQPIDHHVVTRPLYHSMGAACWQEASLREARCMSVEYMIVHLPCPLELLHRERGSAEPGMVVWKLWNRLFHRNYTHTSQIAHALRSCNL